jgi:hypothetical protein
MVSASLRALTLALGLASVQAQPTQSSGLKSINDCTWGNPGQNPTGLVLDVYEPKKIAKKPAIILALCFLRG